MTINIKKDRIEIGNFVLRETADGFTFDGEIQATQVGTYGFQGTVAGYNAGGQTTTAPALPGNQNVIEKFPFSADSNSTDVGDLSQTRRNVVGQSSSVFGYTSGGYLDPGVANRIDKFPFATNTNATNVGNLSQGRYNPAGQSSSVFGYTSGGGPGINVIDKFPFATDSNATDVGDISQTRTGLCGQSSTTSGYSSGGNTQTPPPVRVNTIDKFPFASDTNATDIGDLSQSRSVPAGQSSTISGYSSGGEDTPGRFNTIDKFPFATDANATDVGDLTLSRAVAAGQSSTAFGYTSGGFISSPPYVVSNVIDKFPFSSNTNATDVGDLLAAKNNNAGQQH